MFKGYNTDDKLQEECGVIGIYNSDGEGVADKLCYGLLALQHRGQESAGIAVSSGDKVDYHKDMGLVTEVFNKEIVSKLKGNIGIGHVRYSTTGDSHVHNAQPLVVKYRNGSISLAHNGNLVNANTVREMLEDEGVVFQTSTDSEVVANLMARYHKNGIEKSIKKVMGLLKGAYALTIMTDNKLIAVRDPHGLRPLCVGKTKSGYAVASESCALDTIGAELIRDVEPGEILVIDENGLNSVSHDKWCRKSLCVFELIYFARPDSLMDETDIYKSRREAGKILAREYPVDADVVISVPDSGTAAAIGYAEESGIPYTEGLIKNRYIGRTFIQPTQQLREQGVKLKLNVVHENIRGKRVILVDDSIVRGTTSRRIVDMLKNAGAKEVHVRVSSPPVKYSCYFGIDTPNRQKLIAANYTVEEITEQIHADSLGYISIRGLIRSTGKDEELQKSGFCMACFNGDYPMEVPKQSDDDN